MIISKPVVYTKEELLYDPKIRDANSLGDSIQLLKRRNPLCRIGFTNGKFRMLTPAHCVLLGLCRSKCDILIVALNSDYSLKGLGASSKLSTAERAFVLSSLSVVDYVVAFDEDTPYSLIQNINPDVVFKGCDYKKEDVVSAGKPVEIIDIPFDHHVSDLEQGTCSCDCSKPAASAMRYFKI